MENSTGVIFYGAILDTKILKHIQDEFGDCLQYACVSKPRRPDDVHVCTVYIHIILKRTMNKKTRFLHPIAGLKRIINGLESTVDGVVLESDYIEYGTCQLGPTRVSSSNERTNRKRLRTESDSSTDSRTDAPMITHQSSSNRVNEQIIADVKQSIGATITVARKKLKAQNPAYQVQLVDIFDFHRIFSSSYRFLLFFLVVSTNGFNQWKHCYDAISVDQ